MKQNKPGFTWKQRRFAQWISLPKSKRPPDCQTQKQFSELLGVSEYTLLHWKRLPEFWDLVYKEAQEIIGDKIPAILEAIATEALAGSMTAAKLALEVLGLMEPSKISVKVEEPLTVILVEDADMKPRVEDADIQSEPQD